MINRVTALTTPDVALIWGRPIAVAVASPELLMVANVLAEELQDTEAVTSDVLPSLKVPIAASCCVDPATTNGLAGVIWMDINLGGGGADCEPQPTLTATIAPATSIPANREIVSDH